MAIDSGLGITFNENFPVAGVNQSSQGFRDNFTILKRAIENIQSVSSTASSVLALTTEMGAGGSLSFNLSYPNNALRLPQGSPSTTALSGMIRETNNQFLFHDGTNWKTVITTDQNGGVTIPGNAYLKIPAGNELSRPSQANSQQGAIRFNTATQALEVYTQAGWKSVTASGTVDEFNLINGTVEGSLALLSDAVNDTDAANLRSVRSAISSIFAPPYEGGVSVNFNTFGTKAYLVARPFTVTLSGAVSGNATITSLGDTTITTTLNEGLVNGLDIRDEIGATVKGTFRDENNVNTETGVIVNYDRDNQTLELGVKDFTVALDGAVTGNATISRLGNVVITTTTDRIKGVTVLNQGIVLGSSQTVQQFDFIGAGVSTTQNGDKVSVSISGGLTNQNVRDVVGTLVKGTSRNPVTNAVTETGITVNYDDENNALELGVRNFQIALTGAVQGSAVVSKLGDVSIATNSNFISGISTRTNGSSTGVVGAVQVLNFVGQGVNVTQSGSISTVSINPGVTLADVRNEVGSFVQGTIRNQDETESESGIIVFYDDENDVLSLSPRDFTITLSGDIEGSSTVSRLGNTIITTSAPNFIRGVNTLIGGVNTGSAQSVHNLNFVGPVSLSQIGDTTTVSIQQGLTAENVRDEVSTLVRGTTRDGQNNLTETGITVNYDDANNALELGVRDFNVALTGAVVGNATVSRLRDVVINTTSESIKGIQIFDEGSAVGLPETAKSLNFVGNTITATQVGNAVTISVASGLSNQDVRNTVGSFVQGQTSEGASSGILVQHDSPNQKLLIGVKDFNIALSGAVTGNATVSRLGNVSIVTTTDLIRGIRVFDEDTAIGSTESVKQIKFKGNTVQASQTGNTVTVTVADPLSMSQIESNMGSFISGTTATGNAGITETGITVNYDSSNRRLELGVRDFNVNITGAVTGSGTVSKLGNVTILTTSDAIHGITTQSNGISTGSDESVKTLNFVGNAVELSQNGTVSTITVNHNLNLEMVRDAMATFIQNTAVSGGASGITIDHDDENNALKLGVRDFNIALSGVVTGNATVSKLGNVTIATTSSNLISGLTIRDEGTQLSSAQVAKTLNFVGGGVTASVSGSVATINVPSGLTTSDVRNTVGTFIQGTSGNGGSLTESGITVYHDVSNNVLQLGTRPFTITLDGDVSGSATISKLGNATITTSANGLIKGLNVLDEGVALDAAAESTKTINFVGGGVVATQTGNAVTVNIPAGLTNSDVQNTVGSFVSGSQRVGNTSTESGVTVFHDVANNTLELGVRDFTIGLNGVIEGSATISKLNNAVITTTTTDLIKGLDVSFLGSPLSGISQSVKRLNFTGGGLNVSQNGSNVTVNVPNPITTTDIKNTIGNTVKGTARDPNTQIQTETGVTVNYDTENGAVELGVRSFNIRLAGAVTGNATVSRLQDVVINTSSNFIDGVDAQLNGILLGRSIKGLNILNGAASVANGILNIDVNTGTNTTTVRNVVSSMIVGNQNGLVATYDSDNAFIGLNLKPLKVELTGAVVGNATATFTGSSQDGIISIVTTTSDPLGLEVRDEGSTKGQGVKAVNFVGGGVTSAVSVDGEIATVFIPNSPANEKFILLDNGSSNVPNARKLLAGTGITLIDGGPGGNLTISAVSDEIIGKSQFSLDGLLKAERSRLNIESTAEIISEVEDDSENDCVNVRFYSLNDGWHRREKIDFGLTTDKYGVSIDVGGLEGGIITGQADFGVLN